MPIFRGALNAFGKIDSTYWMGFTDAGQHGAWEWVGGGSSSYTNWFDQGPLKPGSANFAGRDYGTIYTNHPVNGTDAKWGFTDNMNNGAGISIPRGIAEIPFIRRGDSAYVIVEGPTWEEAEANAVKLGGHLVKIDNAEEDTWLLDNIVKPLQGETGLWLGGNDKDVEGIWKWADESSISYSNWGPGQPDNSNEEDYIQYIYAPGWGFFAWNDIGNYNYDWFFVNSGIAEIPLAPNNLPTGTPTLSGTPRPGQTLTLNPASIQDVDNFEGWTPTFEFVWEVSSNNGSTWSRLTSADASDNNSTYILTAADVGKRIRGVVSYLDGYGTVESVPSTSALVTTGAVDTGDASFAINGSPAIGQTLAVIQTANDPDGNGGAFSYQWFSSADGSQWSAIAGASASTWVVTSALSGKQVRAQVSYTDGKGISEQMVTSSVAIAGSPGVTVRSISGNGSTSETGDQAVYSFQLNTRPRDPVSLVFTLSDATEASLSASSLTFSPEAWNTPQTLTLTGRDDFLDDGDISYVVSIRVSSVDPNYGQRVDGTGGVAVANLQLLNRDDGQDGDQTLYGDNGGGQVVNDDLLGNNGRDRLYGLLGRDRLRGGRNDDRIYGGLDDDLLYGEDGHDQLFGEQDDDVLEGGAGNDRLTGGEGADTLIGGAGNDIYVIDDELDRLEDRGLATDVDSVIIRANLSAYVLGAGLENASLEGTTAASLTGNSLANSLSGNAADNVLNGGAGSDQMAGGLGEDLYIVDNTADAISETSRGGSDQINSSVSYRLPAYVETLDLIGKAAIDATGNGAANTLIGNDAANVLDGGSGGRDRLSGAAGADRFRFSSLPDSFRSGSADRITDFSSAQGDRLQLSRSAFAISAATINLVSINGAAGLSGALASPAQLVYDRSSGSLIWNQNGVATGDGSGGVLAVLSNAPALSAGAIQLV